MRKLEMLDSLRAEVRNATSLSSHSLEHNAVAHVENTKKWVNFDLACLNAGRNATAACQKLAKCVAGLIHTDAEKAAIENARKDALIAIDKYEAECERCGPSGISIALG